MRLLPGDRMVVIVVGFRHGRASQELLFASRDERVWQQWLDVYIYTRFSTDAPVSMSRFALVGLFLCISLILTTGCNENREPSADVELLPETVEITGDEESSPTDLSSEMTGQEEEGPIGWIRGVLYDYDGSMVQMANIQYGLKDSRERWVTSTSSSGRFGIARLPVGEHQILAKYLPNHSRLPFVFRMLTVTITAGDTLEVEVKLPETPHRFTENSIHDTEGPAGWIKGILRDDSGEPIPNWHLRFWQLNSSEMWSIVTNEQGVFEIDRLPIGEYILYPGYFPNPGQLPIIRKEIGITITEGDTVDVVISFEE